MTNRMICCLAISLLMGILFGKEENLLFAACFLLFILVLGIAAGRDRKKAWEKRSLSAEDTGSLRKAACCTAEDTGSLRKAACCTVEDTGSPGESAGRQEFRSAVYWKRGLYGTIVFRSLFCLLAFCAGSSQIQAQQQVRDSLEAVLEEGDQITLWGEVQKKEEKEEQYLYYLTDTQVAAEGSLFPCYGILVYSSNRHIRPGNILKVTGSYAPFQISRNEGNFDEKQYYQSKKIEFRLYAEEETLISDKECKTAAFLENLRQKFCRVYLRCMSEKNAGLLADMTLGDKSLLQQEVKDLYRSAGISHILAISGLHVSLFGMGMFRLLCRLGCPGKVSSLAAVGIAVAFGQLSGMEISTVRALLMFAVNMAAYLLGRSYDTLTALGLSAWIQMWENPFVLNYAGFLFSYGAVLGAAVIAAALKEPGGKEEKDADKEGFRKVLLGRVFQKRSSRENKDIERKSKECNSVWKKWAGRFWDSLSISFCIQLATLPLSLYFYYEIPCYGILVNGCILPFLGLLLSLGVLGASTGSIFLPAGKIILQPAEWMLAKSEWICRKSLELPGAVLTVGRPGIALAVCYYVSLAAALYLYRKKGRKKWLGVLGAAVFLILFLRKPLQFEIDVLDVGQGDGIFIQTEAGEHFFVDGGSSDVSKAGTYRILPFLKSRGITSIQGWAVSHADQDHISGLKELLEEGYPVETLIVAEGMVRDEAGEELLMLAEDAGCRILFVSPGMRFGSGEAVFTVWHPQAEGTEDKEDRNGNSLVLSLEYRDFTGFFTGDIGVSQERQMVEAGRIKGWMEQKGIRGITFYKAAHHGSDGSNSLEFLELLSPEIIVVSCGKGNSYGHPGAEAVQRMKEAGSRVVSTMERGQILIRPFL